MALWKNNNFEDLAYANRFICKVTHDFIYPKKESVVVREIARAIIEQNLLTQTSNKNENK